MLKFVNREFNLLLTTTIIESGLDIPTANTILINNADRFGLAELYQLRGRVGRSGEQAYAYLLVREGAILTQEARARLRAIQEFTELGAGFRIAARDLEIRGAGDLLGRAQSGHVAAVGFELYLQMIEEAARELQGEAAPRKIEPKLLLPISAYLPEEYIPEPHQRLSIYKRLASVEREADLGLLSEELRDRYGPPPEPATRLLQVMRIKLLCRNKWVERLEAGEGRIRIQLDSSAPIEERKVERLLSAFRDRIRFLTPFSFELRQPAEAWTAEEIERCLAVL
jgi:transcription-repair coupling factor (superfamily II helicase)